MTKLIQTFIASALVTGYAFIAPAHAAEKTISCEQAIAQAQLLNAFDLWRGAGECTEAEKKRETNFLLIAGQIRAMSDMNVLEPATADDREGVTELYGVLYYRAGGSGFSEVYRDSDSFKQLTNALDAWEPQFSDDYLPGWKYKALTAGDYSKMVTCQKAFRLGKLQWYSSLVQNDEYYELSQQQQALREKNPGAFKQGSDAARQYQVLVAKIKAISERLPPPTETPPACEGIKPR